MSEYALPLTMWAVLVSGKVIALFTDQMEAEAYLRVLRGSESILTVVTWKEREKGT